MTSQEREQLVAFLQQLVQTQAGAKDFDADALIREAASRQPDAAYLLVQRAMGLDLALQAAQAQIAKLQGEVDSLRTTSAAAAKPAASGSFLDSANAWGRSAAGTPPPAAASASRSAFAPAFPATAARASAQPAAPASAWGSGMLASVATTAAGVVAGSMLYHGIQNMMGNHNTDIAKSTPPAPEPAIQAAEEAAPEQLGDYADSGDAGYDAGYDSGDTA